MKSINPSPHNNNNNDNNNNRDDLTMLSVDAVYDCHIIALETDGHKLRVTLNCQNGFH
jgi:hypothetical protein